MKLIDLCKRPVVTVDHRAPLREAARLMRQHHVGALVVTRAGAEGLQVAGIVTDRDLAIGVLARDLDVAQADVSSVATGRVVGAPAEAGIEQAVLRMREAGVRRLLVHAGEGQLVGIVSFDDLFEACAGMLGVLAGVLQKGREREAAQRAEAAAPPPVRIPALGTAGWSLGDRLG